VRELRGRACGECGLLRGRVRELEEERLRLKGEAKALGEELVQLREAHRGLELSHVF
jgi:hypothetical protein